MAASEALERGAASLPWLLILPGIDRTGSLIAGVVNYVSGKGQSATEKAEEVFKEMLQAGESRPGPLCSQVRVNSVLMLPLQVRWRFELPRLPSTSEQRLICALCLPILRNARGPTRGRR